MKQVYRYEVWVSLNWLVLVCSNECKEHWQRVHQVALEDTADTILESQATQACDYCNDTVHGELDVKEAI